MYVPNTISFVNKKKKCFNKEKLTDTRICIEYIKIYAFIIYSS